MPAEGAAEQRPGVGRLCGRSREQLLLPPLWDWPSAPPAAMEPDDAASSPIHPPPFIPPCGRWGPPVSGGAHL